MKYLRVLSIVLCFIFQLVSGAYIPAGGNPNDEPVITDLMVFEVSEKSATTGEVSMLGKIEIGLFGKVVPKTVENFLGLTPMYKETKTLFHRVIPDFVIQGGDFDGKGGHSIFGERGSFGSKFNPMYSGLEDENFSISHDKIGRVSVANAGQNTGGSQFFICLTPQQGLDGKHVVFGQVISGMDIAELIAHVERDATDKPINDIFISDAYTEPYSDTSKAGLSTSSNAKDHDNDASEKSQQESETPAKTTGDGVAPLDPIDNVHDGLNEESYLKDHPSGYGGSSHHFVIIPFVLFAGMAGFMAYKNRRNVTSMIRGPRYRRVAGMNT